MNYQRRIMDLHKTIYTDYTVELSLHNGKDLYNKDMNKVDVSEYQKEIENQIPIIEKQHVLLLLLLFNVYSVIVKRKEVMINYF